MLRSDIVAGAQLVLDAINKTNMFDFVETVLRSRPDKEQRPIAASLTILLEYKNLADQFSPAAKQVAAILGLQPLEDPNIWEGLIAPDAESGNAIHSVYTALIQTRNFLPKFLTLVESESEAIRKHQATGAPKRTESRLLKTLMLEEKAISNPKRIYLLMESIELLYSAVADLQGEESKDLCVIGCDSGSDKSFDFLGLAKVVEGVKEIILSLWDRVVFYREKKAESHLDLIAKSLPILEKISDMRKNGQMEPERAEKIRSAIADGATKFLEAGVTIPEIDEYTVYNPRQLMKPEQKLLTGGPPNITSAGSELSPSTEPTEQRNAKLEDYIKRIAKQVLEDAGGAVDETPSGGSP